MASFLEGGVVGLAVAEAGGAIVEPALEPTRQEAEKRVHARILEVHELAELVATTLHVVGDVTEDALRNGYDQDALRSLIQLKLEAPGPAEAEKLYLRSQGAYPGAISKRLLDHAYGKAGLEFQYWDAMTKAAQNTLLTPAQLALGAVRGTVNSQDLLVVDLDTGDSNVPKYAPAPINILDEAAAYGVNRDRLRALIGSIGLPMSAQQAASATFRGIITRGAFNQAILEGDTRPEWAPFIFEQARQILTAHDYVEGYLRGWLPTVEDMNAGTAKHGMSPDDTDLLFKILGRPLAIHQITTGLARGGSFGGFYEGVPEPYLSAVRESNIRPEYGNLDYANRYTYPTGFQIKAETKDGTLTQPESEQLLLELGWNPHWAQVFSQAWKPAAATTSPHVKSAQTQAVTKVKQAYVSGAYDAPTATTALGALSVAIADHPHILAAWNEIRKADAAIALNTIPGGTNPTNPA